MPKEINDIPLRNAESNQEKQLLGFLDEMCKMIRFGKVSIEITVYNGKLTNVQSCIKASEIKRSFNLNGS